MRKVIIRYFAAILFLFVLVQIAFALQGQPGGGSGSELRAQICSAENQASSSNSYSESCYGTYPGSCPGDLLSCNDGITENSTFTRDTYAGVRVQHYNDSVTNCKAIEQVMLCYEWWVSGGNLQSCAIAVDSNGGSSYSTVSTTCPGSTANPGLTCTNVTSLESWSCNNFFNSSGTRAIARLENSRSSGGAAGTQYADSLFFNVTYSLETNAPEIAVISPTPGNGTYVNSSVFTINVSITDVESNIDSCILTFDNSNQSMTRIGSGKTVSCNISLSGIADGGHNFTIYANDSSGNWAVNGGYFMTVDTTFPLLEFGTGTENNNTNFSRNWIYINVSLTENNFSNITYKLFNSTSLVNQSIYTSMIRSINFTGLPNEKYYYNASISDLAGNRNETGTRIIYIDTTAPNVSTPASPLSGRNYSGIFIINVSAADNLLNVSGVYFNITNGTGSQNATYTASGPVNSYWNASVNSTHFSDGNYSITVYANDTVNNLNSSVIVRTLLFDNTRPGFTLNAPSNDTITLNNGTMLNLTSRDNYHGTTVKIYGGNETSFYSNNSILFKRTGVLNGTISVYNWTSSVLNSTLNTMLLMHFDLEGGENGTFTEDETRANNGTFEGTWNRTEAKFGYSAEFDGIDDEITINDSNSLDITDSFTILFWAFLRDLTRNQTLIAKGSGSSANYYIDYKTESKLEFGFYNNGFKSIEVDASSVSANKWNLISATWNESSNTSRIYVNGQDKGSLQLNYELISNSLPLKIGSFPGFAQNYSGLIDELVVYNRTLTAEEISDIYSMKIGDWYWRVEINDSAGNINISEIRLLRKNSIWNALPSSLGNIGGILDTNISAGIFIINNTHPSRNITINITTDYDRPAIYNYSLPVVLYNTINGSNLIRIQANITTPLSDGSRDINFNISANDTNAGGGSVPGSRIIPLTLIASSSNPFLISNFETAPLIVSQNNTGVNLKASVVNRGQGSAQNVMLTFVLLSGWENTSGAMIQSLGIVEVNQQKNVSIVVSISATASSGIATIYANISGQNSSGADLTSTYINSGSTNITVNAISAGAGPSVVVSPVSESGGGGGSVGGARGSAKGGGSETLTFSKEIEIVRGKQDSFNVEILNRYPNSSLKDITLEITGYPRQYVEIFPEKIEILDYNKKAFFRIKLTAPIYKDFEVYVLKAVIRGKLDTPNALKDYLEVQNIKLTIQAAPLEETKKVFERAGKVVNEMKGRGFNVKQADFFLKEAERKMNERKNKEAIDLSNKIISIRDLAFRAHELIEKIKSVLADPRMIQYIAGEAVLETKGVVTGYAVIDVEEAQEVLDLATVAFERGDYYAALERAEAARLLLVLEGKSNIKLFFYLYWPYILISIIAISGLSILSYHSYQKSSVTRRIEELNFEEERIGRLIIEAQKEYYSGKMSEKEYKEKSSQFRRKAVSIQKERITLRNKRVRLLPLEAVMNDLEAEAKQIENLIKKIQYDYFRDKKINDQEYREQFASLSERLAEIEEERAVLELGRLKKQKARIEKPDKINVDKITKNLIERGNKDIVIVDHKFTDRIKSLLMGRDVKGKWIKINLEKSEAAQRLMEERE